MEWLTENHPDLMEQAIALEENMQAERRAARAAKGKGDICILHRPLREIRDRYLARKARGEVTQMKLWADEKEDEAAA